MRKTFTDAHVAAFYKHLTRPDYAYPGALVLISSYGGAINSVDPTATAVAARSSVMKLMYVNFWSDQAQDSFHVAWMREFYQEVYAGTDGCSVDYADGDLSDPEWNTSGVPWHELYYGVTSPGSSRSRPPGTPRTSPPRPVHTVAGLSRAVRGSPVNTCR